MFATTTNTMQLKSNDTMKLLNKITDKGKRAGNILIIRFPFPAQALLLKKKGGLLAKIAF